MAVRHHGLDRRAGAHLFAADDEGDLDLARGEVLEGPLELDPLGGARRVGEDRLVDRRGDSGGGVHEVKNTAATRQASVKLQAASRQPRMTGIRRLGTACGSRLATSLAAWRREL